MALQLAHGGTGDAVVERLAILAQGEQEVDEAVAAFDGERVLIGHSIFDEISLLYNGKVIAIDLDHDCFSHRTPRSF